jgi:SAM-dependent methyltransferase
MTIPPHDASSPAASAAETPAASAAETPAARPRATFIPGPPSIYDAVDNVQIVVNRLLERGVRRRVLEAGCGSCGQLEIRPDDHLVGIDISEKQLERNTVLHEKIHGDLETYPLPRASFDLVVCWYVLEHLPRPRMALDQMVQALRPGGLLVLAQPSLLSPKGVVTRLTPHWFHVWVYRHVFGRPNAGRDDTPPFPTYLRRTIRPVALRNYGRSRGLDIVYELHFEDYTQRRLRTEKPVYRALYAALNGALRVFSLATYSVYRTDYVVVMQRPRAER